MATTAEFQKMLLTDANARKEFAKNPTAFVAKNNVKLPPGTKLPASIPEAELESAVSAVHTHLGSADVSKLGNDPAAVSSLVKSAFPAKVTPAQLNTVHKTVAEGGGGVGRSADDTIAVVGAVVAAVVAVPVAVYGATDPGD